jgi:8-oxo-dGTP pyrophosphatase MutT (NUDIX family)
MTAANNNSSDADSRSPGKEAGPEMIAAHELPEVIKAAGGLVWRTKEGIRQIALVLRRRYRDWSLPKGKLDEQEEWLAAAEREVREELGVQVVPGEFAGAVSYRVGRRPKLVLFWNMTLQAATATDRPDPEEIERVEWLAPAEALRRLTYQGERDLLRQFLEPAELEQ